jgi:hypothetical protein
MRDYINNRGCRTLYAGRRVSPLLLACLLTLLVGGWEPLPAKTLEWRLMPEQRLKLIVERTTRQRSPSTDWTETIQYQVLWVVTARDEEHRIHLLQKLTEVKHTLQLPGSPPVVYDSSLELEPEGDAAELARYWRPLLQTERPLTLSPRGELIRTETPPAVAATASAAPAAPASSAPASSVPPPSPTGAVPAAAGSTPTPIPATTTTQGNSASTRVSAPRALADIYWTLPADELSLGDSWAETQVAPWRDLADALKITFSYTYQGEEEIDQRLLDKIVVQVHWDVQPTPAAPRQLSIDRQASRGVIHFDGQAGHLARAEFSHDLGVRVTPSQADPVQAEISLLLSVHCHPVLPEPPAEEEPLPAPAPASIPPTTPAEGSAAE